MDWHKKEVELIVDDYFSMLEKELENTPYNKTSHRNEILPKLNNRSAGSVEFKHQNISAVLINRGLPFIKGYKPRYNIQSLLDEIVLAYVQTHEGRLIKLFEGFWRQPPVRKIDFDIDFGRLKTDPPKENQSRFKEAIHSYQPIKINYLEKEQNNRLIGEGGEKLIIEYEKWRLRSIGKESLADRIEWVSKTQGDGLGFDILSKNENGSDRYIEVKTTKLTKETPIYLTRNELDFAREKSKYFYLYRIYEWGNNPKFFDKNGSYQEYCSLVALNFRGYIYANEN